VQKEKLTKIVLLHFTCNIISLLSCYNKLLQ